MLKTRLYSAVAFLIAFTIGIGLGQLPLRRLPISPTCDSQSAIPSQGQLTAVAISQTGRFVLSGDQAGHVCLWDGYTHRLIWQKNLNQKVLSLAFSTTGSDLSALTQNGQLTTLDVETGILKYQAQPLPEIGIEGGVLQYTGAGNPSAMVFGGTALRNWATINGRENRLHPFDSSATCITWSIQANRYALGNQSGTVKLYDKETFTEIRRWDTPFPSIRTVGLSPQGKWLVVAGDGGAYIVDTSQETLNFSRHDSFTYLTPTCASFSNDETMFVVGYSDGSLGVWLNNPERNQPSFGSLGAWFAGDCCRQPQEFSHCPHSHHVYPGAH